MSEREAFAYEVIGLSFWERFWRSFSACLSLGTLLDYPRLLAVDKSQEAFCGLGEKVDERACVTVVLKCYLPSPLARAPLTKPVVRKELSP